MATVTLSRSLAESILTLMERAAEGERLHPDQWRLFAGDLHTALNEAQLGSPTCAACGNWVTETEHEHNGPLCDPCATVIAADLSARDQAARDQAPDDPGSRCTLACGYCGRCGGA